MNRITRAAFARLAGISRAGACKVCAMRLSDAMSDDLLDLDHPDVIKYLNEKEKAGTAGRIKSTNAGPLNVSDPRIEIQDLEHLTVKEVVTKYGDVAGFGAYVKTLKELAEYKNKELITQTKRGQLVDRDALGSILFGLIDQTFTRLVSDIPEGIVSQIIARALAGGEDAETEILEMIKTPISKALKDVKADTIRRLQQ